MGGRGGSERGQEERADLGEKGGAWTEHVKRPTAKAHSGGEGQRGQGRSDLVTAAHALAGECRP